MGTGSGMSSFFHIVCNNALFLTHGMKSWFNAWITIVGLLLAAVSTAMGMAVQVQSYAVISQGYEPVRWHAFLVSDEAPPPAKEC